MKTAKLFLLSLLAVCLCVSAPSSLEAAPKPKKPAAKKAPKGTEASAEEGKAAPSKQDIAKSKKLFKEAQGLAKKKKAELALAKLDAAIALNESAKEFYSLRGDLLTSLKKNDEAIAAYEKFLAFGVTGKPKLDAEKKLKALQNTAVESSPKTPETAATNPENTPEKKVAPSKQDIAKSKKLFKEAQGLAKKKKAELALAKLDAAIALNESAKEFYSLRGDLLTSLKKNDEAIVAYEKFLSFSVTGKPKLDAEKKLKALRGGSTSTSEPVATVALPKGPATATLSVEVTNGPANVYLGSKNSGVFCKAEPSCQKALPAGSYTLIISKEGNFVDVLQTFSIADKESKSVVVTLETGPVKLHVESTPVGAEVRINGKSVGLTPLDSFVPIGNAVLEIVKSGYALYRVDVTASDGGTLSHKAVLQAEIRTKFTPENAELLVNGQKVTVKDGLAVLPVKNAGQAWSYTVQSPGFVSSNGKIPDTRDNSYLLNVALEPKQTSFVINEAPQGALLRIDGQDFGTLPLAGPLQLSVGQHTIEVSMTGFAVDRRTVVLEEGKQYVHTPKLKEEIPLVLSPLDAKIFVNEIPVEVTNFRMVLPDVEGPYLITARSKGFKDKTIEFSTNNRIFGSPLEFALEASDATLVFKNLPSGSKVYLDEQTVSLDASTTLAGVSSGKHSIRIETPGALPYYNELVFSPNTPVTLDFVSKKSKSPLRLVGFGVAGVAAVAGGFFGLEALQKSRDFQDLAEASGAEPDLAALGVLKADAQSFAKKANIGIGASLSVAIITSVLTRSAGRGFSGATITIGGAQKAASVEFTKSF